MDDFPQLSPSVSYSSPSSDTLSSMSSDSPRLTHSDGISEDISHCLKESIQLTRPQMSASGDGRSSVTHFDAASGDGRSSVTHFDPASEQENLLFNYSDDRETNESIIVNSHINNLDDYSLLIIISKLTIMERMKTQGTCRKWYQLIDKLHQSQTSLGMAINCANCPIIGHQVSSRECIGDMFESTSDSPEKVYFIKSQRLSIIMRKFPNLRSLVMQNCIFSRDAVEVFANLCSPFLEHIDLSFSSCVINEIVRSVSERCRSLKHVILQDNEINENGLRSLVENCQNMELLILDKNEDITGECFNLLGPNIRYLSIPDCNNIGSNGINALVSGNGVNLTFLKIGNRITPEMLQILTVNLQNLNCLEFTGFPTLTPIVYNCIGQLTQLRELILTLPNFPFDTPLIEIIRNCENLKIVKIEGPIISNTSLMRFHLHCPLIEQLSICPAPSRTNDSINDDCIGSIAALKQLRRLSLSGSMVTDAIVHVINCCPRLSCIELDNCRKISNITLNACIESAAARGNDKFMLYVHRTPIVKPNRELPSNLIVFGDWGYP